MQCRGRSFGGPLPSISFCPIVEYMGFSRALWENLKAVYVNESGVAMAEDLCCNTHLQDSIDENPFGTEDRET